MSSATTVIFLCSHCAAGYQATQKQYVEETSGSFRCQVCLTQIHEGSGSYDYLDWKAVETVPKPRQFKRQSNKARAPD
jgi:hypothetical protein